MFINSLSDADFLTLFKLVPLLEKEKLSPSFISTTIKLAQENEGVYNLLMLWKETSNKKDKAEIIADIQDLIEDSERTDLATGVYIRFDDLEKIASHIDAFKNSLLMLVNKKLGGISKLSELTGIPQPSLSRFFNSSSMPRKTTLFKIAKAMKVSQVEIANEWAS